MSFIDRYKHRWIHVFIGKTKDNYVFFHGNIHFNRMIIMLYRHHDPFSAFLLIDKMTVDAFNTTIIVTFTE